MRIQALVQLLHGIHKTDHQNKTHKSLFLYCFSVNAPSVLLSPELNTKSLKSTNARKKTDSLKNTLQVSPKIKNPKHRQILRYETILSRNYHTLIQHHQKKQTLIPREGKKKKKSLRSPQSSPPNTHTPFSSLHSSNSTANRKENLCTSQRPPRFIPNRKNSEFHLNILALGLFLLPRKG